MRPVVVVRRRRSEKGDDTCGTVPLSANVGTYVDSLYGEATVTLADGRLTMQRGDWTAPLEYWNASNFQWGRLPSAAIPTLFVRFDVTPDGKVSTLSFGIGGDNAQMTRKPPPRVPAGRNP